MNCSNFEKHKEKYEVLSSANGIKCIGSLWEKIHQDELLLRIGPAEAPSFFFL